MTKRAKNRFNVTKAVKANARERLGQPKSEVVLPTLKEKLQRRAQKHKTGLGDLLEQQERDQQ